MPSPSGDRISTTVLILFFRYEDANILDHIHVGQILNIRFYSEDKMEPSEIFLSEIRHMTKKDEDPYTGHQLVGLMILEK